MEPVREQEPPRDSQPEKLPIFDAGIFTIEFLPTSPEGLQIQTDKSLMRHAPNTPLPEARRIRKERDREPLKFRTGEGFKPKIGIRNLRRDGDEITVDTIPVTFPTYKAISNPGESEESLSVSNPAATAGILLTTEADGSHKIVLQHRSPKNFFFGDIPGASVAGYLDGELSGAVMKPIDTAGVKSNLSKELEEELGISEDAISANIISGISKDKTKIHDEFLLFGKLNISVDQVRENVERRAKEKRPNDEFDFEGKYFIIDGTPEAIYKLLTEVQCPLPPTHTAAFVAAGYNLVLERDGLANAQNWMGKLEAGIKINYEDIDRRVKEYWQLHPDLIEKKPDDKPTRNIHNYDPTYTPSDQGLPDITSELVRVGLIESPQSKEIEHQPDKAWLFDVDGVITNPTEKEITEPEIITEIINRLKKGEPVSLVSGRALPWLREQVVSKILSEADDKSILDNFFVSAEFGGVSVHFENGVEVDDIDQNVSVPRELLQQLIDLVNGEFSDVAFVDPEKVTHFTAEMQKGVSMEEFKKRQLELSQKMVQILGDNTSLEIHNDRIATNVKNKNLNKHLAIQKVLTWLDKRGIDPKKFEVFGDSESDFEMGRELANQGREFTFVYVGESVPQNLPFEVIHHGNVDRGTREYLQNN